MSTIPKPKKRKRITSLALSADLLKRVEELSGATKRSRSELAETFLERGLEAFEEEVDTDALLYEGRKQEKDILLKDRKDILRRLEKIAKG
jgi:predicted transcriptional regulator